MAASRIPELIANLVAALDGAATLSGVKVVDGPLVSDSAVAEWVFVGYDGDPEGDFISTQTSQEWAGIGAFAKNEAIAVTCSVLIRQGSTDVATCRARTFEVFAAVEAVLRADVSMGLPPPTVCAITEHTFHPEQTGRGIQGRLPFTITCTTRI